MRDRRPLVFQLCRVGNNVRVRVPYAETGNDDVDKGDEEDDDDNDVVEDIGRPLVGLLVDVEAADDEEEDADNYLFGVSFELENVKKKSFQFMEMGK